ncbi:MAG TPA: endonuclease/exonuclease/phosphatase family protein [Candidatus Saccharimonadales bacterium]|nr:endonuclease/exonuclease/phosphatase family protein [Candidatus Saccharimonadales bacterium]
MTEHTTLSVVSYNIQFGINTQKVIGNIQRLVDDGADVICLQEIINVDKQEFIIDSFLKQLGKNWLAAYHVGPQFSRQSIGTCILWNKNKLKLEREEKTLLPKLKEFTTHEKFYYWVIGVPGIPLQRRVTTCYFSINDTTLRISSIHVDNVGGPTHRLKQLTYLLSKFKKEKKPTYEILCGDFNTMDLLHTGREEKLLQKRLGMDFIDASRKIPWTSDIYNINFTTSIKLFPWIIKWFHIHIRRKLDYIWVRNIKVTKCIKLDLPGSDHSPLFARLEI